MKAFELARTAGADGLEFDVRLDGEENVVVFHDETLQRMVGRGDRVDELSVTERAAVRIQGEPMPLLSEVLDTFDLEIDVEIKTDRVGRSGGLVAAVAKLLGEHRRLDRVMVTSFDPIVLMQMHARLPDVSLGYIFHDEQPLPLRRGWVGRWIGVSIVHPQHTLCTEASVKAWHTAGRPVNTWTVDDADELRRLVSIGVDGVFANDPGHALAVIEEAHAQLKA